jgi:hypothetical protein
MADMSQGHKLLSTIDVRELSSIRWGPLRQFFPSFAEEIELGRYLKKLLRSYPCAAVEVRPHQDANGNPSAHTFDIFVVESVPTRGDA